MIKEARIKKIGREWDFFPVSTQRVTAKDCKSLTVIPRGASEISNPVKMYDRLTERAFAAKSFVESACNPESGIRNPESKYQQTTEN
jgi:predicted esterase